MTQSLHNIHKPHIHTSIKNWRSPRWCPLTHTILHLHCRLTTTQGTGSGHVLCRHHHHIYTHNHECIKKIDTTIPTKSFTRTKHNNITLNQDKTTCTLFTPAPTENTNKLDLKINNTALPMATHPKVLGLTLDPKLTYSTHIHNITVHAHKPLQIIKTFTATGYGNQKETLMATYKASLTKTYNIQHTSTLQCYKTIFNNGRYTTNILTDSIQSLHQTYKPTCAIYIYIYCL